MNDLKIIQQNSGRFDIVMKEGLLEEVSGLEMKEQFIKLLVYSTWKPLIKYGVDIGQFRGSKLSLVKSVILDRLARSIAFINYFYPEEAKLPDLIGVKLNVLGEVLKILVKFEGMEVEIS